MLINSLTGYRLLLLLVSLTSFFSYSACTVTYLTIEPVTASRSYNVFESGTNALVQSYRLKSDIIGEGCEVEVELSVENELNHLVSDSQQNLIFDWHSSNGYQRSGRWYTKLSSSEPDATFQLNYPSQQRIDAGSYFGRLQATIGDPDLNVKQASLDVSVSVPPTAKIQFYGLSQNHYDLDLGVLTTNKTIGYAPKLWIESNSGYRVSVESLNRGSLRHQSEDIRWDIGYKMYLDSQQIEITSPIAYWRSSQSTFGRPVSMEFVVGDVVDKPAGQYRDTLQISIEPELTALP